MIARALEFLGLHPEGVLATVSGGRPQTRVFQVMKIEHQTLFFATSPRKEVYSQLQADPHVEFLAMHGQVSVRCAGTVDWEVSPSTRLWIYSHNAVLSRLYSSADAMVYFRLPILRLDYYDLRPTPPVSLRFDLSTGQATAGYVGERFEEHQA